jgi:hypothetical protein
MRTHVTFQADFPKDAGPDAPAGRDLAQHLASWLSATGFSAAAPEVHEGYAYTFACKRDNKAFVVFVGLVDDGVLEWLVYAEPQVGVAAGLLRKVGLGSAKKAEPPLLQELCAAIHRCLRDDPRFQSTRWYTTEGWDTNPDADWARAP